ncbi:L-2-hydroxyglutarate oxidase [Mycolicibacterium sediminis]|uniref:Hydroxyglutarate oxidase n=1 Tax=Mycolicibacterium sediminis TaxID=1286180 RepID=A0A7I7QJG5_9MYCO|nr:L-2-hydroxyglutarate oxidase [Mycolicibacterium sediminis]BBY26217.1 hydroxyglutarate oxidase [Mycolicibacterium sediminis]
MTHFGYCVIGAGIVGLATAHRLLTDDPGATVAVVESEDAVARHQTGHNSGVIHSGIYYEPGSLKATLCKAGEQATKDFCATNDIPFDECGKLIVATDPAEVTRMDALAERAVANGIEHHRIDQRELGEFEPEVAGLAALFLPRTGIVDYRRICTRLAELVVAGGGVLRTGERVVGIAEGPTRVTVTTNAGTLTCDRLVACAGLQADRVAAMAGVHSDVRIMPFRGEYFQLPADRAGFVRRLIYPVPDPTLPFLGVHLSPTIDGRITVGPNAVLGLSREGYPKLSFDVRDVADMARFPGAWRVARSHVALGLREIRNSAFTGSYLRECRRYAPALTKADLLPHPAGIRAQAVRRDGTLVHDFVVERTARMVHVLNSPSPAATAALPIARHVATLVAS